MRTKNKSKIQRTKGLTAVKSLNLDKENGVLTQAESRNEADHISEPQEVTASEDLRHP